MSGPYADVLRRIDAGLDAAERALERFTPGAIAHRTKDGDDPVTEADTTVDTLLRETLPAPGDGWLSEETVDDRSRLGRDRVWIVDPIDGTKEFVAGIPEWCVSIALVEDGRPVAGGVSAPSAGQRIVGAIGHGVTVNGHGVHASTNADAATSTVLASRSEVRRGEWDRFRAGPFWIRPMGSVAWKLARVAGGFVEATWTLVPKNEWDVAGGAALVLAAGGRAWEPGKGEVRFNRERSLLTGFAACTAASEVAVRAAIED